MEPYCPCTWQKNEKNKKLKFVNEDYIYCSYNIIFQSTLYTVYLFSEYADN